MNNGEKLERLTFLFEEYLKILEENKGKNWSRGIIGILASLTDNEISIEQRLEEAKYGYKSMLGGMGSLSDFWPYHPDEEISEELSNYLQNIRSEIWNLFDLSLSSLPSVDEGYPPGHPYWSIKDAKEEGKE